MNDYFNLGEDKTLKALPIAKDNKIKELDLQQLSVGQVGNLNVAQAPALNNTALGNPQVDYNNFNQNSPNFVPNNFEATNDGGRATAMVRVRDQNNGVTNVPTNSYNQGLNNLPNYMNSNAASSFILIVVCVFILIALVAVCTFGILNYIG